MHSLETLGKLNREQVIREYRVAVETENYGLQRAIIKANPDVFDVHGGVRHESA